MTPDPKQELIKAAVSALLAQKDVIGLIAEMSTGTFVQRARGPYRANGFDFTDDDIRNIHDGLRLMVWKPPPVTTV